MDSMNRLRMRLNSILSPICLDFIRSEAKRLRLRYPKIMIAPLMYLLDDNKLYMIAED
jgi:hypothetical protein